MYRVGDKVVHPMHGAGIIQSIAEKNIDGIARNYYVLKLSANNMQVMIPTKSCQEIGLRPIADEATVDQVFEAIVTMDIEADANWNRRYRENMVCLKSGDLMRVARVVKGLVLRERQKGLSTGERKMLTSAKQILISEIVLVKLTTFEEIEKRLDALILNFIAQD